MEEAPPFTQLWEAWLERAVSFVLDSLVQQGFGRVVVCVSCSAFLLLSVCR